jgi:hypothetical protein
MHLGTVAVVSATQLALTIRMLLIAVILFSMAYWLAREALRVLPNSWRILEIDAKSVRVECMNGAVISGQIQSGSLIFPLCIVLCIRPQEHLLSGSTVLFRDALNPDEYRRLCVQMNMNR